MGCSRSTPPIKQHIRNHKNKLYVITFGRLCRKSKHFFIKLHQMCIQAEIIDTLIVNLLLLCQKRKLCICACKSVLQKYSLCSWASSSAAVRWLEALGKMHMKENGKKKHRVSTQLLPPPRLTLLHPSTAPAPSWSMAGGGGEEQQAAFPHPSHPHPSLSLFLSSSLYLSLPLRADIRSGCAIMPKALERTPWQPPLLQTKVKPHRSVC